MAKSIPEIFALNRPHANLDAAYGPYTTLEEALLKTQTNRSIGLTIGVLIFKEDLEGTYIESYERIPRSDDTYRVYKEQSNIPEGVTRYICSGIEEYWWKKGTRDEDLEVKIEELISSAELYVPSIINYPESPGTINFSVNYSSKAGGRISVFRNDVEILQ